MKYTFRAIVLTIIWIGGAAGQQPMERMLHGGLPQRLLPNWWREPALARKIALSAEQLKKMDDIFLQHRLKLIELNASLGKEETLLEPLVAMDQPDEKKVRAQIDRIAQARADLEKENAYLLLGIRLILTPDQWKNLQAETSAGPKARAVGGGEHHKW